MRGPRLAIHSFEVGDHALNVIALQPSTVHFRTLIALEAQMYARNRRDRAGGAQHMKRPSRMTTQRRQGRNLLQLRAHLGSHRLICSRLVQFAGELLRQRDDAERHRTPPQNPRWPSMISQIEPNQLRRPAANVEDQRTFVGAIQQRRHTARRQPRLFDRRNDVEVEPRLLRDACNKRFAILCRAARLGRDRTRRSHAALAHLHRADTNRLDRTRHRSFGKFARLREPFAQSNRAGK